MQHDRYTVPPELAELFEPWPLLSEIVAFAFAWPRTFWLVVFAILLLCFLVTWYEHDRAS